MRKFSVKFPAEQNLPLKNFLGTSSRVPLFFAAMELASPYLAGRSTWPFLAFLHFFLNWPCLRNVALAS